MRRPDEKQGMLYVLLWLFAYCLVTAPIKGKFGFGSLWMLLALAAFAVGITTFVKRNHLGKKYGLTDWPANAKECLVFIPMWILATGNLWFGFAPAYQGMTLVKAVLSMILVGYVEEMIFRGFLFQTMLIKNKASMAITVSALTFGIGHIANLFAGQAGPDTALQIVFAVCWGFMLTMAFYRSGSLIPCIIAHAMIDVFSLFAADGGGGDRIYTGVTVAAAVLCGWQAIRRVS